MPASTTSQPILTLTRVYEQARPWGSSRTLSIRSDPTWSILITFGPDCADMPKGFRKKTTYCSKGRFSLKHLAVARLTSIAQGEWRNLTRPSWSITKETT